MLDSHHILRRALSATGLCWPGLLWSGLIGAPAYAQAVDRLCAPKEAPAPQPRPRTLRGKFSRFAPRLQVRLWFEPHYDDQDRARAQSDALSEAPAPVPSPARPLRRYAKAREPFGWQISVRWDLAEVARAANPRLFDTDERLTPTTCLGSEDLATRLLYEGAHDIDADEFNADEFNADELDSDDFELDD